MKKLFTFILLLGFAEALFLQTTQTIVVQPSQTYLLNLLNLLQKPASTGPSVRLHGYATYALADNHVDSYYSETQYFDGSIEGGLNMEADWK